MQYQDVGIPEYWIVNPEEATVLVLTLAQDVYGEGQTLQGSDPLISQQLGPLGLTVTELFAAVDMPEDGN